MSSLPSPSELLGYTSIAAWLGAQFPQVLENYRRQSCEGLALPFLANWLLGDFSNLVGCILTHQLPFQTWLATYFVAVDLTLVAQYFYYQRKSKSTLKHERAASRRLSVDRAASRYRTLSAAAANVAATAALVAEYDEQFERRRYRRDWQRVSLDRAQQPGEATGQTRDGEEDDDDVDEHALAALADSFHSEGGRDMGRSRHEYLNRRGGSLGPGGFIRHGRSRHATIPSFTSTDASGVGESGGALGRGRSISVEEEGDLEAATRHPHRERRSSRASRRGATMVFLGMWALFGVGSLTKTRHEVALGDLARTGEVLSAPPTLDVTQAQAMPIIDHSKLTSFVYLNPQEPQPEIEPIPTPPPHQSPPSTERILGRVFAWLCTTLYLTSRLPQIWKNYTRKSVEGLSIYLFVFAFLGNVFYVSSILSSPQMHDSPHRASAFLKESIPYLLGSGGTLMFDITIVTQSFIYRPKAKRHTLAYVQAPTEQTNLLASDTLAQTYVVDPHNVVSRGRTMPSATENRVE
ncbi:hypothetical protein AX16_008929 [Volvariella volvacea WC 439]|nr:hypothetical protein AX16_008929 [Volvariella volvacea WC 439]